MINSKINIISDINSPRLTYILDFIFNQFFNCGYELSSIAHSDKVNIAYKNSYLEGQFNINNSHYLDGTKQMPSLDTIDPTSETFDLFAFVFFFLSRAEEYDHKSEDFFGRFDSTQAHFKEDVHRPMVDIELLKLADKIFEISKVRLKRRTSFKLIHTVDVDQFYAFKNKSLKRTVGGLVSATLKANIKDLKDRAKSLTVGDDPYDSYDFLQEHAANIESYYFILVGSYDKFDNALDISQEAIGQQILKLSTSAKIGLHPSIKSHESNATLNEEKEKLEIVLSERINESRQHFLKLHIPSTYRSLIDVGIMKDHSMGYHDAIGFRAGTSNPFYWFDLEKNQTTSLLLQPLLVMDVSLKKYLKLDPQTAIAMVKEMIDQCNAVQAPFSLLWHNSSFYEEEGWAGWKEVYLAIVNYCQELSA